MKKKISKVFKEALKKNNEMTTTTKNKKVFEGILLLQFYLSDII